MIIITPTRVPLEATELSFREAPAAAILLVGLNVEGIIGTGELVGVKVEPSSAQGKVPGEQKRPELSHIDAIHTADFNTSSRRRAFVMFNREANSLLSVVRSECGSLLR